MTKDNPSFPEIKKELVERVESMEKTCESVEKYMAEGIRQREELTLWMKRVHVKVYGDDDSYPKKIGLDGRVDALETVETNRIKIKEGFLKVAVGSLTMGIGGAVIWAFLALKEAFTKGH